MADGHVADTDAFRGDVRSWLAENFPPSLKGRGSMMLAEGRPSQDPDFRAWVKAMGDKGWGVPTWPKAYGGVGRPQAYQDIVNAEMARQKLPFVPNTIGLNWAGPLILAIGSEAEKQRYIRGILNADDIWCQGFSEPDQGSDLANSQLRAVRDGDHSVLNGSKIWTSLGSHAKYMILLARTNPDKPRYDGLSFFLVPMHTPGIEARPIRKLTGEYGFNQTFFNDARIPADCLMGREGEGWKIAMLTLTFERGATGGQAGGITRMALGVGDVLELARRSRRLGVAGHRRAPLLFVEALDLGAQLREPLGLGEPGDGVVATQVPHGEVAR
jgi:alkylation response protein AidB-like acyl-CoA dehydrogenase